MIESKETSSKVFWKLLIRVNRTGSHFFFLRVYVLLSTMFRKHSFFHLSLLPPLANLPCSCLSNTAFDLASFFCINSSIEEHRIKPRHSSKLWRSSCNIYWLYVKRINIKKQPEKMEKKINNYDKQDYFNMLLKTHNSSFLPSMLASTIFLILIQSHLDPDYYCGVLAPHWHLFPDIQPKNVEHPLTIVCFLEINKHELLLFY